MSNISVVYNGSDITESVPVNGVDIETSHSMAGESLQVDTASIDCVGSTEQGDDGETTYNHLEFSSQAPVTVSYYQDFIGKYYAREMQLSNKRDSRLTAYSAVWLLKLIRCDAMFCVGKTVGDALTEIFGHSASSYTEGQIKYSVDDDVAETELNGLIDAGTAYTQIFEILLATGAGCYTASDGTLRFRYPIITPVSTIDNTKVVIGSYLVNSSPITYLRVAYYQYVEDGESKEIWSGVVTGTQEISFDAPHINYTVSGGTILSYDYTHCKVKGTGAIVTISAEGYVESVNYLTKGTTPTGIDTDSEMAIEGHRLVSPYTASYVRDRFWSYYTAPLTFKGTIICSLAKVGDVLEKSGDVISLYRPDTKQLVTATIYKMRYQFGTTEVRASIEALMNFTPQEHESGGYSNYKLLQGNGTFDLSTIGSPSSIFVIVVGGGTGGSNGGNGGDTHQDSFTGPGRQVSTSGGSGGAGGSGGSGGLVNMCLLASPESSIAYSCGSGGASEEAGGTTYFGDLSSSGGSRYSGGYTDKLTGYVFGKSGSSGIKGANGGAGSNYQSTSKYGSYGGNCNGHTGGTPMNGNGVFGGGGGGGASASADGGDAPTKPTNMIRCGGAGANADAAEKATGFGTGGNGGNGGGGAGGMGCTYYTSQTTAASVDSYGGTGGAGGEGADGAILILY